MRMLTHVHCPLEPLNSLVRDGSAGRTIRAILEDATPEAAYFSEYEGERGGIFVVDVTDVSEIPRFAEP